MILEGIVTTINADGRPHLAPMGPRVELHNDSFSKLLLRPFPSSTTYKNLQLHGEGVFHLTDDVRLIARAAVGRVRELPEVHDALAVRGFILSEACRAFEFKVVSTDTSKQRMELTAEVVAVHSLRYFWGFNRAKNAVLEAAILLTRMHILPPVEIERELKVLRTIVDKTAGPEELEAMAFLQSVFAEGQK